MTEGAERMSTAMAPKRPGVVTLVGILVLINAALAAIGAIATFFNRDDGRWQEIYGATSDELMIAAIVEAVLAVLLVLVGTGVLSGAKWARLAAAIVVGLRIIGLSWYMVSHLGEGAFAWNTMISLGIGLFVLWALYGNDESQRYYEAA
jgi:hypothetical protein